MNEFLIQLIVRSVVIIVAAFAVTAVLRRASASTRYLVWAVAIATIVALPVALIVVPHWKMRVDVPASVSSIPLSSRIIEDQNAPAVNVVSPSVGSIQGTVDPRRSAGSSRAIASMGPESWLIGLYLLGVLVTLGRIAAGRYALARISHRAASLDDNSWQRLLNRESERLEVRRAVRLLASDRVSTPLTAGIMFPVILLPSDCIGWSQDHREVVVRHELAHIARNDALVCLIAGIACAMYCFNPLVWIAARKLRTEQERSCDDRVITLGTDATDYAEHLLTVAKSARNLGMQSFVSVAMARPSQLEGRLLAVLQSRSRSPLTRGGALAVGAAAFVGLVALAAIRPVRAEAIVVASQSPFPLTLSAKPVVVVPAAQPAEKKETSAAFDSVATGEVAVSSGGTLTLDLRTGAGVRITGTDDNYVRMRAELAGRAWRNTLISIVNEGADARITTRYRDQYNNTSSSHRITVTVPRRYNVRIESAGGEIVLRNLEGSFTGTTGGGEIDIANVSGRASLTTGGGEITVRNSNLAGSVGTGGGSVLIEGVTGGLRGSSGTGDVFYGGRGSGQITYSAASSGGARVGSDGKTYVRKSGGDVRLGDVGDGASISTGGGDITIGASRGAVEVSTGGGNVTAGPLYGGGKVGTGAGNIRIEVAPSANAPIRAISGSGTVTLILPRNLNADLELETAFTRENRQTRIISDWPLTTTVTDTWDGREGTPRRYVRVRQSIGSGGPTIRVNTVNGDIIIRRQ